MPALSTPGALKPQSVPAGGQEAGATTAPRSWDARGPAPEPAAGWPSQARAAPSLAGAAGGDERLLAGCLQLPRLRLRWRWQAEPLEHQRIDGHDHARAGHGQRRHLGS